MAGTSRATSAGTMKIPDPITHPTTTQNASIGPSTLGKVGFSRAEDAVVMDEGTSAQEDRLGKNPHVGESCQIRTEIGRRAAFSGGLAGNKGTGTLPRDVPTLC
jgi:hypothetical protein